MYREKRRAKDRAGLHGTESQDYEAELEAGTAAVSLCSTPESQWSPEEKAWCPTTDGQVRSKGQCCVTREWAQKGEELAVTSKQPTEGG